MPVNKAALIGVIIGLTAAGSMAVKLHKSSQSSAPQSRAAVEAFAAQVSDLQEYSPPSPLTAEAKITDEKGRKLPLSDFKNKPVIINLWATWCAPCVKELPSLAKLKQARPDLHVLAVSLDLEKDLPELAAFLKKYDAAALDVYSGKGPALKKALPYKGLPTTYVLSSEGKILFKIEGDTDWSSHITSEFIDYMLKIDP